MKTSIINVRIDNSIKQNLERRSLETNKPISNLVRDAIELLLNQKLDKTTSTITETYEADIRLLQSLEFTELIYWIMDKGSNPDISEIAELYAQHMSLILELKNNSFFKSDIINEFMKIYNELYDYLHTDNHMNSTFNFPEDRNGFNYEKLHEFIHTIRYNDDDEKIVHIK